MLGVRRTSVTAIARPLQDKGLIKYRRGQIRVLDRAGLEERACECYFTLQDRVEKLFQSQFDAQRLNERSRTALHESGCGLSVGSGDQDR
jgi:Mn-dependent DtxR family transcriptional regulator